MHPKEIICEDPSMLETAKQCSEFLSLPLNTIISSTEYLLFSSNKICCINKNKKQALTFEHNFEAASIQRRIQSQDQHLLKAFKDKQNPIIDILDVTAGWCRDSFILAQNGYHVCAVEQSALIYFLTQYSLTSYLEKNDLSLKLFYSNSFEYLNQLKTLPSAIYLDPMFPSNKHQAKNKKEIQLLQAITQNVLIEELMTLALNKAQQRVVVKRPLHSEFLNTIPPDFQYKGKTIRFDIYQCAK